MNKLIKMISLTMALTMPSLAAHADGKIAVLDVQQAIVNTDFAQARLKKLKAEKSFKENRKQLEDLTKGYQKLVAQLQKDAAVMSDDQKQAEAQKLQEKRSDIEHVQHKLQLTEKDFMQDLMKDMGPKVKQVVDDMIKSEGIGLLINRQAAMYVDSSYSITAQVTDKLNKMK